MGEDDSSLWNVEMEVNLFHAMRRHKPVGKYWNLDSLFTSTLFLCKSIRAPNRYAHNVLVVGDNMQVSDISSYH